jgi:hypothetical protein
MTIKYVGTVEIAKILGIGLVAAKKMVVNKRSCKFTSVTGFLCQVDEAEVIAMRDGTPYK